MYKNLFYIPNSTLQRSFVTIWKDGDYSPGDDLCLDALIAKMKVPPDFFTTRKKLFLAGKEREEYVSFVEQNKR